jgi:hypothetical protein
MGKLFDSKGFGNILILVGLAIVGIGILAYTIFWRLGNAIDLATGFGGPVIFIIGSLVFLIGICAKMDSNKPQEERRLGLRVFGSLLAMFGIGIIILGLLGGNILYILIGVLILIGGAILFFNPYCILKK